MVTDTSIPGFSLSTNCVFDAIFAPPFMEQRKTKSSIHTSAGIILDWHLFKCNLYSLDSQAVELLRRSAATATLVIERFRQPEPEGPHLDDLEDLLRTSV